MADRYVAWIGYVTDTDPGDPTVPRRWWSGEDDLVFEGHVWRGAFNAAADGALIDISDVSQTIDLPGQRTSIRLAVSGAAIRHALSVNMGAVEVHIGWIFSLDEGATWMRVPRRIIADLSETKVVDGELIASLDDEMGDGDRGRPLWWSDASQQSRSPGDRAFAQAGPLASDRDIRWPPGGAREGEEE